MQKEIFRSQSRLIQSFVQVCKEASVLQDDLIILNHAKLLRANSGIRAVFFRNARGEVFPREMNTLANAWQANFPADFSVKIFNVLEWGERLQVWVSPVLWESRRLGVAVLGFSDQEVEKNLDQAMQGLLARIGAMILAALAVGMLAAFWMAKKMIRPIRSLQLGAAKIGQGDFSAVLHLPTQDELSELAASLNHMARALGELDQMKEDFIAAVTHELRSPVKAIETYLNLMQYNPEREMRERGMRNLEIMRNNIYRLHQFIDRVLDVAKLERGKVALEVEVFKLQPLLQEIAKLFQAQADQQTVRVEVLSAEALTLSADRDLLFQVLTNLVSNALKFTPAGGTIALKAKTESDGVLLEVADTGSGIPASDLERIFNKFEQVKVQGKREEKNRGTGLGLAISKGIVEAHGGTIWVESELGKGSTFRVKLPTVLSESS